MTDILLGEDLDLQMANGDLVVELSDAQHFQLLLLSHKAEWRQWPLVGVGIGNWLLDDVVPTSLKHEIATQAEYDGAKLTQIEAIQGQVKVKGYYGT